MSALKSMIAAAALSIAAALPANAQRVQGHVGFNSLENAIAVQEGPDAIRSRLYTNLGVSVGDVNLKYSGFNEVSDLDFTNTYFGRQAFYAGTGGIAAALVVRNGASDVYDVMAGVHMPISGNGFYGFADIAAGPVQKVMHYNTTGFVGHDIANTSRGKIGGWAFWSADAHRLEQTYTEAQLEYTPRGKILGLQPMVFTRYEQNGLGDNARGLAGIALQK